MTGKPNALTAPSRRAPRAFVAISLVNFLLTAGGYLFISHSASTERARQEQQSRVLERKLCTTFGELASLRPPAGNPAANPSRAYLQEEHDRLVQLGADVGCG